MQKPQKKHTYKYIENAGAEGLRMIDFAADPGIAKEFEEFGIVQRFGTDYRLYVSELWDFNEVLAYMKSYKPVDVPDAFKD
jgi:hypothetical protein